MEIEGGSNVVWCVRVEAMFLGYKSDLDEFDGGIDRASRREGGEFGE